MQRPITTSIPLLSQPSEEAHGTEADLAVLDVATGTLFAADLAFFQRAPAGAEVGGPLGLVQRQRLGGVARHGVEQLPFGTPLRHMHPNSATSLFAEQLFQDLTRGK